MQIHDAEMFKLRFNSHVKFHFIHGTKMSLKEIVFLVSKSNFIFVRVQLSSSFEAILHRFESARRKIKKRGKQIIKRRFCFDTVSRKIKCRDEKLKFTFLCRQLQTEGGSGLDEYVDQESF